MNHYAFFLKLNSTKHGDVSLYKDAKSGNKYVAIKTLNTSDSKVLRMRKKECQVHKLLCRRNIVQLRKTIRKQSKLHFVMDYCSNGDLYDMVEEQLLDMSTIQRYFSQIVHAVNYIHGKGYAHRDLSLENILVDDQDQCQVTDFGFAVPNHKIQRGKVGKVAHMAPEMVKGGEYLPAKADMWSLGTILFILCTGHPPVSIASAQDECMRLLNQQGVRGLLRQWELELPEEVIEILENLLQVNTIDRWNIKKLRSHPWIIPEAIEVPSASSNKFTQYFLKKFTSDVIV